MIHRGRALLALAVAAIALAACYQAPAPVVQKDGDASGFPAPEAKPGAPDGTPAPGGGAGVVVARGDTLFEIAREQDVPLRDLIELNRLSPPYTLLVGQVLKLPGQRVHVVEKGDTVYAISRRYDIAMSSLVRLNGIEPPYTLYVGDTLSLPASTRPASAVVAVPAGEVTAAALLPPEPTAAIIVAPAPTPAAAPAPAETAAIPAAAPEVAPPPASPAGFSWPAGGTIISGFGPKPGNLHNDGVNIALAKGTPVLAARGGTVAYVGNELKGYGNLVLIRHEGGWVSAYAHNDALLVSRGQRVARGDVVAYAGNTGSVASPQLHFELRKGGEPVDPVKFLGG